MARQQTQQLNDIKRNQVDKPTETQSKSAQQHEIESGISQYSIKYTEVIAFQDTHIDSVKKLLQQSSLQIVNDVDLLKTIWSRVIIHMLNEIFGRIAKVHRRCDYPELQFLPKNTQYSKKFLITGLLMIIIGKTEE